MRKYTVINMIAASTEGESQFTRLVNDHKEIEARTPEEAIIKYQNQLGNIEKEVEEFKKRIEGKEISKEYAVIDRKKADSKVAELSEKQIKQEVLIESYKIEVEELKVKLQLKDIQLNILKGDKS